MNNQTQFNYYALIIGVFFIAFAIIGKSWGKTLDQIDLLVDDSPVRHIVKVVNKPKPVSFIREVSAYNVGDVNQTDSDPCISAGGYDLCMLLDNGVNVCAMNDVLFLTEINIADVGDCVVLDRLPKKYNNRVDWAFKADEYQKAIQFGVKSREITILTKM